MLHWYNEAPDGINIQDKMMWSLKTLPDLNKFGAELRDRNQQEPLTDGLMENDQKAKNLSIMNVSNRRLQT